MFVNPFTWLEGVAVVTSDTGELVRLINDLGGTLTNGEKIPNGIGEHFLRWLTPIISSPICKK